jgi:molybdate transport system ATP-binding protein
VTPSFVVEASFQLAEGTLVLFGATGAGKSVIVRTLAGLVRPVSGVIRLGREVLVDIARSRFVPPQDRGVGYAPQHGALFPHLRVAENVLVGAPKEGGQGTASIAPAILEGLALRPLLDRAPDSLSGGERQRVALARALARRPRLLLLDEPLSALHLPERRRVARWLCAYAKARSIPVVLVTHDPSEASEIGDHLVLVDAGRTLAEGAPGALLAALSSGTLAEAPPR